jgi:molybdate transport system substrate-binding protein
MLVTWKENAMKIRALVAAANIGLMFLLMVGIAAQAAEVKVLSAEVMKPALTELTAEFERMTSHKLTISYDSAGGIRNRVQGGEAADVAIIQKPAMETLSEQGKIARGSVVTLARSGVAVAVRKGAPKPDIGTADALKRSLLAARSIAYPDPARGAASGIHFRGVIERLGIAQEVNAKAKLMKGTLPEFAAHDEAEIAITQPMEILSEPSYDLVDWLPDALQNYNAFTWAAGVTANAKEPDTAKALIKFLSSPAAAAVIKKRGMNPATP